MNKLIKLFSLFLLLPLLISCYLKIEVDDGKPDENICPPSDRIAMPVYKRTYFEKAQITEKEIVRDDFIAVDNSTTHRIEISEDQKTFTVYKIDIAPQKKIISLNDDIELRFLEHEVASVSGCVNVLFYQHLRDGEIILFDNRVLPKISSTDPNLWYFKYKGKLWEWDVTNLGIDWR